MLKKRLIYGGLATIGTSLFALAMVFPIGYFLSPISGWTISPLTCSAAIAFVALAASFPLWCGKRRAWLVPFIISFLILVLDVPLLIYGFDSFIHPSSANWILYIVDSAPLYLIPICALAISFSMLLAGAIVARKLCYPS